MSDLGLFENQLPYFVLEEIYKLASSSNMPCFMGINMPSFIKISRSFFGSVSNLDLIKLTPEFPVKHFTDWRSTLLEKYPRSGQNKGYIGDVRSAMKLSESRVKFKKTEGERKLSFEKHGHELQLPSIEIADGVECLLRIVIALEQRHYPKDTHICGYVTLMDRLIDGEEDVDLLVESGIISNKMGDNSSIADIFNKLCQNFSVSESFYYNTYEELIRHSGSRWNKTKAKLRRVYFSDLWIGTESIVATLVLLLTVMQAICSILQDV